MAKKHRIDFNDEDHEEQYGYHDEMVKRRREKRIKNKLKQRHADWFDDDDDYF